MSSMNNVSLIGRLTQDPDLRYTQSGKAVSSFGIAINEKYKSGDEWKTDVCFVEITAWDKTAEATAQYLKKGHLCGIFGEKRRWIRLNRLSRHKPRLKGQLWIGVTITGDLLRS